MIATLYKDLDIEIQSIKNALLEALKKASEEENLIKLEEKRKAKEKEDEDAVMKAIMKGLRLFS